MSQSKPRNPRLRTLEPSSLMKNDNSSQISNKQSRYVKLPRNATTISDVLEKKKPSKQFLQNLDEDFSIISEKSPKYKNDKLKVLTNQAYAFQKQGKLDKAFQCIQSASNIENIEKIDNVKILLNKSALMNKAGKHQESMELTKQAFSILKDQSSKFSKNLNCSQITQLMVICFYNISAELQCLGRKQQARNIYGKGLNLSVRTLGPSHQLSRKIKKIVSTQKVAKIMSNKKLSESKQTPKYSYMRNSIQYKKQQFKQKAFFKIADQVRLQGEKNSNILNIYGPRKRVSKVGKSQQKVGKIQHNPQSSDKNLKDQNLGKQVNSRQSLLKSLPKQLSNKNNKRPVLLISGTEGKNQKNSKQSDKNNKESQCTIM